MNILHIDSSASAHDDSHSRRLSAKIVERLKAANPDATVTYRDTAKDRPPHVDTTIREAWMPQAANNPSLADLARQSKEMVAEIKAADVIVIGSPMYNFSVPSTLKAWIDYVAIAGQTFRYTPNGPEGLLEGRAYLALSSGGVYSEGPAASADHLSTYLRTVLGFMGISDVEVVRAEGTALGEGAGAKAMASAHEQIDALFAG